MPQSLYDQLKKEVTDRGMEVKETLKKFQGKVFHAVNTTHGYMLRYRYIIIAESIYESCKSALFAELAWMVALPLRRG